MRFARGGSAFVIETAAFLVVSVISYFLVGYLRVLMLRWRMLDVPNERSSHTVPTPRGGGLSIVILTLLGWVAFGVFQGTSQLSAALLYAVGAAVIAIVSWWDDMRSLSPAQRFVGHFVGAFLIVLGIGYWSQVGLPFLGVVYLGVVGALITVMWIVGLTNAYNFMDGIDGIAGGQALIAGLGWVLISPEIPSGDSAKVLGLLIAGSSLGFLTHNWHPAKIFMGDVGSAFLGYSFAFISVFVSYTQPEYALVGALLVWPFIFDTGITFLRRLLRRENVLAAHRSHLYQRLIIAGYGVRSVTLLYMTLAVIGVIGAWMWIHGDDAIRLTVILLILVLSAALWLFVNRVEARRGSTSI